MSGRAVLAVIGLALLGSWLLGQAGQAGLLQSLFDFALFLATVAVAAVAIVVALGLLLFGAATGVIDVLTGRRREPINTPPPKRSFESFRKPD